MERILKEGGLRNDYKTQKKESQISWPQRHWLLIAVVTFILTSIIAPLVVEKLKPTLLPAPTEGQLKFEETDSPNKDTTTVLPTAEPNIKSDTTNQE